MTHARRLWSIWQALLSAFAWAFTGPSFRRFAEWVTAMAINSEEHTITQSVLALERPADWKAPESFAEYGAWHPDYVTASLTRLVETAPGRLWHGYHISAVDDTKVHRNSPDVLGNLHLPRIYRPLSQSSSHRAGPQLGGARGPARQPRSTSLVPAPVGTALLPEIPVASSIPGLRSHRSFPDQM